MTRARRAGAGAIDVVFFDIGGVLGTNGWDREQRSQAIARFGLDEEDFQYRHEETVGTLEEGAISLDEYLDVAVFCAPRNFSRQAFKEYMFSLSEPWPESVASAQSLAARGDVRLMTLNNESEELNNYRIEHFGLRDVFGAFFSSCWLGARKPTRAIYHRALGMAQVDPRRAVMIDDRDQNLAPARALGMHTIRFESAQALHAELGALGLI
jgi:putative hydrolase of the HAD superfamily